MENNGRIIPKLDTDNFYICDVGISFVLRTTIFQEDGLQFIPDGAEDYLFLDKIRSNSYNMMISPYVTYFVRKDVIQDVKQDWTEETIGNRVFINTEKNNLIAFWAYMMIYKTFP